MYSSAGGDIVSFIYLIFFFIIVVSCCCSDSGSSGNSQAKRSTTPRRNMNSSGRNEHYRRSYSECPSCGAPYYDGYCEEWDIWTLIRDGLERIISTNIIC